MDLGPSWLVKINRKGEILHGNCGHNNDIHAANLSRCRYCKNLAAVTGRVHVISQTLFSVESLATPRLVRRMVVWNRRGVVEGSCGVAWGGMMEGVGWEEHDGGVCLWVGHDGGMSYGRDMVWVGLEREGHGRGMF